MRILIVGHGGREHALLWRLRRDDPGAEILFTAGNAGMEQDAEPVPVGVSDVRGLVSVARARAVDLTVIGPEAPLAAGLADAFAEAGLPVFGPRRAAAEIESSKAFAKAFMLRHGIPTAEFRAFTDPVLADAYLESGDGPVVVKASGLAGGKGAIVCETRAEAREFADAMLRRGTYGDAAREVVIEERLLGRELSVIALTDGETVRTLVPARDHKRALDGDRGPNTGGMGALAPVPDATPELVESVLATVLVPAVRGLAAEGRPFRGALYAGLMLTPEGPRVIEFNARFGDPEAQAVLPLLEGRLPDLLRACSDPPPRDVRLADLEIGWSGRSACCVVAASAGYPGAYETGSPIDLDALAPSPAAVGPPAPPTPSGAPVPAARAEGPPPAISGGASIPAGQDVQALVFHAGTARAGDRLVTAGGRVLSVTGLGDEAEAARHAAYARLTRISFPGMRWRSDVGLPESARAGTTSSGRAGAAGRGRASAGATGGQGRA